MGLNNPIPRSLKSEKAAKILASFIKPNQVLGADEVIPREVLLNAKGLAVITILKAGFLFSGRAGSGIVVARLPDGSWSAPSAIVTAGAGVGGQIGAEVTDFVFILNTQAAVESFAQFGSVTLGGNISVAAGPLGRNAEVAGSASLKNVAPVFAYSKTKGLFAGVSVEGSVLVERREANRKFYGDMCKASQILGGRVRPPPACEPLMRVLNSRAFTRASANGEYYSDDEDYYNDIPSEFSSDASSTRYNSRRSYGSDDEGYSDDDSPRSYYHRSTPGTTPSHSRKPTSWEDDVYDRYDRNRSSKSEARSAGYRPKSEKPDFGYGSARGSSGSSGSKKAIALYTFAGEQQGDLGFKKGDVITIIQKSDSTDDWWTGRIGTREGIFPANYVELV
ncbi:hypothetical protein KL933_004995 [Ogataea haglerorum]|uniref:SH3 domain-containing protein n=1 Tax=Ogataea haglerorum TaxID=1937702 RepID=A0AAN6HZ39_9ASCO|nr:uncharacterized protein KL911_005166 [Ogataea haglerorum]KAG7692217.1 hypothetical protein KL951_005126 [Ogataea haglerorum]KAG7693782.1 hypothetical protein KL915_004072 [Ogataea haglerorum]KAG7702726.1 hypothetical protein KL914_005113 [Ogataea haglerorum]KAG7702818.1 hypothetical protein KL950_005087 [Ogataea haglerorum]KAG7713380.1 hypothetical protein KL913_005001 [Ogataea haglerorum]